MPDPRPRNGQGQFSQQDAGGADPGAMSVAYDPRLIETRKRILSQKAIEEMKGAKPMQNTFGMRLRLRELAARARN